MKVLWYPKRWRKIPKEPWRIFVTSNRVRAYNMHEGIKGIPNVQSEIAGLTDMLPNPFAYDVIVFQKYYSARLAFLLRRAGVLVVWDVCDPVSLTSQTASSVDLIITSSHGLAEMLAREATPIPIEVVVDAHEANPAWVKKHEPKERLVVTWYGTAASADKCLAPLKPLLDELEWVDFHFASTPTGRWAAERGFRGDLNFHHDWRESDKHSNSWQEFIFESDVGIAPVFSDTKSPHKILNYMAYGIPVVCSPNDGHRRIIQHGANGFLAESPAAWVEHLSALRDPALREQIGAQARQTAAGYTVEAVARRYYTTLERHLEGRKRHRQTHATRSTLGWLFRLLQEAKIL